MPIAYRHANTEECGSRIMVTSILCMSIRRDGRFVFRFFVIHVIHGETRLTETPWGKANPSPQPIAAAERDSCSFAGLPEDQANNEATWRTVPAPASLIGQISAQVVQSPHWLSS